MSRMTLLLWLLHVYIGGRLLPDLPFGIAGVVAGGVALLASAWLIPYGFNRRRAAVSGHAKTLMWAGLVALGAFSTLFVLTALRDAGLVAMLALASLLRGPVPVADYVRWSAVAVPIPASSALLRSTPP